MLGKGTRLCKDCPEAYVLGEGTQQGNAGGHCRGQALGVIDGTGQYSKDRKGAGSLPTLSTKRYKPARNTSQRRRAREKGMILHHSSFEDRESVVVVVTSSAFGQEYQGIEQA